MKDLITSGKLKDLGLKVFGQKIDENAESSYTAVIPANEECLIVKEMLEGRNASGWFNFLCRYQKHYSLSPEAIELLLADILKNEYAKKFCAQEFKRYGFNEAQAMAVCKNLGALEPEFIFDFCKAGRMMFQSVHQRLQFVSPGDYPELCEKHHLNPKESFGDVYARAVREYRKM